MNTGTVPHYRSFLEREFSTRVRRNPSYSLRAFARDIGIQPSKLSEVLRGVRGLSPQSAEKIVSNVKFSAHEQTLFLNLVDLHQKKNRLTSKRAEETLKTIAAVDSYGDLSIERFKIIADWHHFAILELTELENFESNTSWIAGRLNISSEIAGEAVERLIEYGLLERSKEGQLKQTHKNLATPSGIPSREIREHHSQILMKADKALDEVDIHERDFSAITLAFHSSQMEEVRTKLKEFRRTLGKDIQDTPKKDRVYCLAINFFPLDRINGAKS